MTKIYNNLFKSYEILTAKAHLRSTGVEDCFKWGNKHIPRGEKM